MATSDSTDFAAELGHVRDQIAEMVRNGAIELPMLPEVSSRVLSLCTDPDADASRLAAVIHEDQALAGHVLRVANSPAYLPKTPIRSLQQAVSRLGLNPLREIVMTVAVQGRVFQGDEHQELIRKLWRHSVGAAFFAREIARTMRRHVEGAFLWGLMHDVGRVVILDALNEVRQCLGVVLPSDALTWLLDELHCVAGAALAEAWQLPESLPIAILYHHGPAAAPAGDALPAWITNLADTLSHRLEQPDGLADPTCLDGHPALDPLNLYPEQLEQLIASGERIRQHLESIA